MYFHLLLLRMGLQKESIRKVWIVGPIRVSKYSDLIWDYHVATIVYTKEKGWVTIDTNESKPEPVRDWVQYYTSRSVDGKARLYVTDPAKLSINTGTYDRVQLGLTSSRESDWFKGYFVDLLASMKRVSLATLGVKELERKPRDYVAEPAPPTVETGPEKDTRIFGFVWNYLGI